MNTVNLQSGILVAAHFDQLDSLGGLAGCGAARSLFLPLLVVQGHD